LCEAGWLGSAGGVSGGSGGGGGGGGAGAGGGGGARAGAAAFKSSSAAVGASGPVVHVHVERRVERRGDGARRKRTYPRPPHEELVEELGAMRVAVPLTQPQPPGETLSTTLVAINMPNGAHHSDLSHDPPSPTDTSDVTEGRALALALLQQWLYLL
jgi:hypothetical protein